LVKKWSCCTLLEVFKVQMFSNVVVYPHKSCEVQKTKTGLICSHSTNEIFREPLLRKKPKRRKKTVAVNHLAQE
jgi:hypothetical protein